MSDDSSESDDNEHKFTKKRKHKNKKHSHKKNKQDEDSEIEKNRETLAKRSKQWTTVDSSSDEDNDSNNETNNDKTKIHSKNERDDESDSESDSDETTSKKLKKSKHKKDKSDKKSKKHKSKHKKSKHNNSGITTKLNQNEFGKYGIIREEHYHKKQREFEVYMSEVKNQPGILGQGKFEIMKAFKSYIEDYNTATLPHKKYYDYEAWEMEEYRKQQANKYIEISTERNMFNDEAEKRIEMKRLKEKAEIESFQKTYNQINIDKERRESMKRQEIIKTDIQLAFKQGDMEKVKKLERLLAPDEAEPTVKHPWS